MQARQPAGHHDHRALVASASMTLDLPVPDIPVNSTRFTAAIL
jgi:hypothetical protein